MLPFTYIAATLIEELPSSQTLTITIKLVRISEILPEFGSNIGFQRVIVIQFLLAPVFIELLHEILDSNLFLFYRIVTKECSFTGLDKFKLVAISPLVGIVRSLVGIAAIVWL